MRNVCIEYCINNGKLAIRISAEDKNDRAMLIQSTVINDNMVEKVFVFGTAEKCDMGRPLFAGTRDEGLQWLERFRMAGATVIETNFFVPFSNGHNVKNDMAGRWDFYPEEIEGCRVDIQTLTHVAKVLETRQAERLAA